MGKLLLLIVCLFSFLNIFSQEIMLATDFTLTDIDDNEHHLYEYLNNGTIVILDFFTVNCLGCQERAPGVEQVYLDYGPTGDNTVMILGLEVSSATSDTELRDYAETYICSNPQINNTKNVDEIYRVLQYPTYFVICPDRTCKIEDINWPETIENDLKEKINDCKNLKETTNDVRIVNISESKDLSYCETEIKTEIEIQNYGSDSLTSVNVVSELNNETIYENEWVVSLAQFEVTRFEIAISNLISGENKLSFNLENPNGIDDDDNSDNTANINFYSYPEGVTIIVEMELQWDPGESSWEIKKNNDIISARYYYSIPWENYQDTFCLEDNFCYDFILYDVRGNGLYGNEYAKIIIGGETVVDIQQQEFFVIKESFCLGTATSTGLSSILQEEILIYPNPVSRYLFIENIKPEGFNVFIFNMLGQVKAKYISITAIDLPIDLMRWKLDPGFYFIEVQADDYRARKKFTFLK